MGSQFRKLAAWKPVQCWTALTVHCREAPGCGSQVMHMYLRNVFPGAGCCGTFGLDCLSSAAVLKQNRSIHMMRRQKIGMLLATVDIIMWTASMCIQLDSAMYTYAMHGWPGSPLGDGTSRQHDGLLQNMLDRISDGAAWVHLDLDRCYMYSVCVLQISHEPLVPGYHCFRCYG